MEIPGNIFGENENPSIGGRTEKLLVLGGDRCFDGYWWGWDR